MHSNETIAVLGALKRMYLELLELRAQVEDVKNTLERIEQTGGGGGTLSIQIEGLHETPSNTEEEDDSSGGDTPLSAPF